MKVDSEKVVFLRGLLVAFASNGQLNYDEMRRLCRLNDEQMGSYLDATRKGRGRASPTFARLWSKRLVSQVRGGVMPKPGPRRCRRLIDSGATGGGWITPSSRSATEVCQPFRGCPMLRSDAG